MSDDLPEKPLPIELRRLARDWFAETRQLSAQDDAEIAAWRASMKDADPACPLLWERIDWMVDREFYRRDRARRHRDNLSRRLPGND